MPRTGNIMVGQSGGPTPVINASLLGVVEQALREEQIDRIYGTLDGLRGILQGKQVLLNDKLLELRQAARQPGAVLGTSRHPLKEEEYARILTELERLGVTQFFYIGGNGSSRTVLALSRFARERKSAVRFVHIPKTIDNDLDGTDHTPGYGSASKFLSHVTQWFALDMLSLKTVPKIEIVEVMGGNRGWLPAASALFKKQASDYPNLVYLPDKPVADHVIFSDIQQAFDQSQSIMLMVPDHLQIEGLPRDSLAVEDQIRHNQDGIGYRLSRHITRSLGIPTRVTVPYALYRIAPGYLSQTDYEEAFQLGMKAVEFANEGRSGGMVSLQRIPQTSYSTRMVWVPLEGVAGKEKEFPAAFWNSREHRPTDAFRQYVMPLIDNQVPDPVFTLREK